MKDTKKINVSSQIFIDTLMDLGLTKRAREFAIESGFSIKEIDQMKRKSNGIEISEPLKEILNSVLSTSSMARFENGEKTLLIFPDSKSNIIAERIEGDSFEFSKHGFKELSSILRGFYGWDTSNQVDPMKINIGLTSDIYDLIHGIEPSVLDEMIEDESFEVQIRHFLLDFKRNHQQVSKIIFKKRRIDKYDMEENHVMLFVPSESFIWHINYEGIKDDQIILTSNTVPTYLSVVQKITKEILQGSIHNEKKKIIHSKEEQKKFSFRRGFSFFWKSNLILFTIILALNINRANFSEEGGDLLLLMSLLWEAFLILLSIFLVFTREEF
ncbi:hypothetical protein [Bacillus massilinigeriensis]|uniref:hypothetical protein n=1 Tax=Bacillus mediterraneensis TaxID=1805474 RepID=UPI0008F81142|nr:hypothetical protein [Bacillus mediterraneensis]